MKQVKYTTKYVANCVSAEFRQEPSNSSTVLYDLNCGESVSFERDVKNGYSKVVHNGVTGYVLASYLSDEKTEDSSLSIHEEDATQQEIDDNVEYGDLISNRSENYIEEYITTFVRPLYNRTNENIDLYSKSISGSATLWYDNKGCVKKELPRDAENYNMSRQYYYDTSSGKMVFAFVFAGTQEHRLYFDDDKLVRYIDEAGSVFNNPTSIEALQMAEYALYEAY